MEGVHVCFLPRRSLHYGPRDERRGKACLPRLMPQGTQRCMSQLARPLQRAVCAWEKVQQVEALRWAGKASWMRDL